MPRLLALSDLHINRRRNRDALETLPAYPDDWLIVAGDVGDDADDLAEAWRILGPRFARLVWVPGNHELWVRGDGPRGTERYDWLVACCRAHGVLTPADPWETWTGPGGPAAIVPLFTLYDYTFKPDNVAVEDVVRWAAESGIHPVDERFLATDPYPDIAAWSAALTQAAEQRLASVPPGLPIVAITHFPLRQDLVRMFRYPRFTPWCGTRSTEAWHTRFPIKVAVHGHLHMRSTDWRSGVRFEEAALGYPRHWDAAKGPAHYLREILPGPAEVQTGDSGPNWYP